MGETAARSGGGLGSHSEEAAFHSTAADLPMHSPLPSRTNSFGSDAETLIPDRVPSPLSSEERAATDHLSVADGRSVSPLPLGDSLKKPGAGTADLPTHMPVAGRTTSSESRADAMVGQEPMVSRKPVAGDGEKSSPAASTSPQVTHLTNELAAHPSLTPTQVEDFMNKLAAHPSAGAGEKSLPSAAASSKSERQSVAAVLQKVGQAIRNNPIKTGVGLGAVALGTGVGVGAGNESPSE